MSRDNFRHPWCEFPDCGCVGWCRYSRAAQEAAVLEKARQDCTFPRCDCSSGNVCLYMAHRYPMGLEDTDAATKRRLQAQARVRAYRITRQWAGVDPAFLESAIGARCPYCQEEMTHPDGVGAGAVPRHPTRDHVDPRGKGGANAPANIVVACWTCNNDKDDLTLVQWYFALEEAGDPRARHVAAYLKSWNPAKGDAA